MLGYHVGNEVVIAADGTGAAPFVKAAARDIKAYLYVGGPLLLRQALMSHNLQKIEELRCSSRIRRRGRPQRMA